MTEEEQDINQKPQTMQKCIIQNIGMQNKLRRNTSTLKVGETLERLEITTRLYLPEQDAHETS